MVSDQVRRGGRMAGASLVSGGRGVLLVLVCLVTAGPFLWMAVTSLMGQMEVFSPDGLLPESPRWSNYPAR